MSELFRPHCEPARTIYDALSDEQKHRQSKQTQEWIDGERDRAWREARDYAQKHGGTVPTMADIIAAENQAIGHCDYTSKFAIHVAQAITSKKP